MHVPSPPCPCCAVSASTQCQHGCDSLLPLVLCSCSEGSSPADAPLILVLAAGPALLQALKQAAVPLKEACKKAKILQDIR